MRTQTDWQIVRPVHTHQPLCQPISTCFTSLTELPIILYLLIKKKVGRVCVCGGGGGGAGAGGRERKQKARKQCNEYVILLQQTKF